MNSVCLVDKKILQNSSWGESGNNKRSPWWWKISENTPSVMMGGPFQGCSHSLCNSQQDNAWSSQAHQAPSYKRGFRGAVSMGLSASFYLHCPYQARPPVLPLKLLPTLPGSEVLPFPLLSYSWLQKHKLWHLACLVWILALPLTCCVTLDDLLNFSEPLHL